MRCSLFQALRDCSCLYKKNPFLQQQLLPLMHRVLAAEPTLPVVSCALKTLQMLTQLLLLPRGGEGSQQLQQQLRVLLPDALAKLKVNNRPVQAAACACIGTYLSCVPIDVIVGDLLPIKEKLANYQKLLLDELTKAVGQQGGTPAFHRATPLLLAAAQAAAEDGNAAVRAAGVSLLATIATHAEGSAVVGDAMQKLSEQKRQQLQKALAVASTTAAPGVPPPVSSPRRSGVPQGSQTQGVPFSRMRSRGAATAGSASTPAAAAERPGAGLTAGQPKTARKQASGSLGSTNGKGPVQRSGSLAATIGVSVAPASHAPSLAGGMWEVSHATVGLEEAEEKTRELLPPELLQGLEAAAGVERKKAYNALEAWCRRPCECRLCGSQNGQMETEGDIGSSCRLVAFRQSAVHVLQHLRTKLRGFKERTSVLEEACISCLQSVIGGLLLPGEAFKTAMAPSAKDAVLGASTSPRPLSSSGRHLPPVDRSIVNVVLEPLADRLGDPRVGSFVVNIGLLLAKCVETPTIVAAQLALLAEGRVGGGRLMQGVCTLLEQLLLQWGLQAFTPLKQLLMILRQMLEPNKVCTVGASHCSGLRMTCMAACCLDIAVGLWLRCDYNCCLLPLRPPGTTCKSLLQTRGPCASAVTGSFASCHQGPRSVVFPLLKRLYGELGEKTITAMLVAYPLPEDVKHALKQQRQQQQQQQHLQHQQGPEGSGPAWGAAAAALTAGAAAHASAVAGLACRDSVQPAAPSGVSVAQYFTPELLQRLQHGHQEELTLKALHELLNIFVTKAGNRVKPEGQLLALLYSAAKGRGKEPLCSLPVSLNCFRV